MDIKTEYESIDLDDSVKKEEFFEKIEEGWCDGETGLSHQSKKISKRRKKYQKIDNEIRLKIIEEVQKNGKLLKNAAEKYNVNYSSAKSIFHVYRKEGRVLKKPFKGRASKTIFHLANPIVYVNLPNQNTSSSAKAAYTQEKGFYSPVYQQIPSVRPLTIDPETSKENSPTNIVPILHPSSAFMLQSFCNQNISISPKTNLSCNQNAVEIKRRDHLIKPIHDSVQKIYNYPTPAQNFQNYQHFNKGFLPGLPMPSPVSESLKKAYLINEWVKNQWKAIDMGL